MPHAVVIAISMHWIPYTTISHMTWTHGTMCVIRKHFFASEAHTRGGWKLVRTAQMKNIWSATSMRLRGITPSKIWNFLIRSIHRSTWILRDTILLVSVISLSSDSYHRGKEEYWASLHEVQGPQGCQILYRPLRSLPFPASLGGHSAESAVCPRCYQDRVLIQKSQHLMVICQ